MTLNQDLKNKLLKQLERDEGREKFPYPDPKNPKLVTVGIGRNLTGEGLSEDEIDYLCNNDIENHYLHLATYAPWIDGLDDVRLGALLNLCFEVGVAGLLGFTAAIAHMEKHEYPQAAQAFKLSAWAKEVPLRADRITLQIESGAWQ